MSRLSFIEVHDHGTPRLINVGAVKKVSPAKGAGKTIVYLYGELEAIVADESYATVLAMIRAAGGHKLTVRPTDLSSQPREEGHERF